jgi:hypothetical protein
VEDPRARLPVPSVPRRGVRSGYRPTLTRAVKKAACNLTIRTLRTVKFSGKEINVPY